MYIIIVTEKEKWVELIYKDIKPIYLISNYGRVMNKITGEILSTSISEKGYVMVSLMTQSKKNNKTFKLHRIMAFHFLKLPDFNDENTWTVNHKNGNKLFNYFENLEWVTFADNIRHSFREGLNKSLRGESNGLNKYPEKLIHDICYLFQKGENNKYIRKYIEDKYKIKINRYLIFDLRHRKNWINVTRHYKY